MEEKKEEKTTGVDAKIDGLLIEKRIVFLAAPVDDQSAKEVIRTLWYLEHLDPKKPILFVINSPGGSVDAGFSIWDQVKMIRAPVYTMVMGLAASMGSILSLVAEKGKRFSTANARFMIHQPSLGGTIQGQATDLEIQATEILKTRDVLIRVYVEATGKDYNTIERALDRDTWMSPKEALEYGLIDKIVTSYDQIDLS